VLAAIAAAGLVVANHNGGGQIVAAGRSADLVSFAATPPAGARVRPLAVEAAFHSPFMAPARGALADATQGLAVREPSVAVISNADGEVLLGGREVLARLVSQVTSPVRWDLCVARLGALGVTAVLELAPGGVLGPMVRRALPQVEVLALRSPEDLPAARAMLAEHAGAAVGAWA
jgi:[acyl-carrier-protein] S-malonyltransferase